MLGRYTEKEMRELWLRPEASFERWLEVEGAALRARADFGEILHGVAESIIASAKVNVARIEELEAEFDHDMIAFVVSIQESLVKAGLGDHKEEFHKNLSSYSIEDPAQVLALRKAVGYILAEFRNLEAALRERSVQHKWDLMIARTHGQYAEPTTFGALLRVLRSSTERSIRRIQYALDFELCEANMGGAVGIFGDLNPAVAEHALRKLKLRLAKEETQILQRDRHAFLLAVFATAAASIEQMCRTFWEMMRSEVRELREPRRAKQRGSSAMSHKRNPILTERLIGMARLLRATCLAALENVATPEHRDISQSSVERHILPDATTLLHYMARKAGSLVKRLEVFPKRMLYNLNVDTQGVWASQRVRNVLMVAGVPYEQAYNFTQRLSFEAVDGGVHLRTLLDERPVWEDNPGNTLTAPAMCGQSRINECFDATDMVRQGVEYMFGAEGEPEPPAKP